MEYFGYMSFIRLNSFMKGNKTMTTESKLTALNKDINKPSFLTKTKRITHLKSLDLKKN